MNYKNFFNTEHTPITTSLIWADDGQLLESVAEFKEQEDGTAMFARRVFVDESKWQDYVEEAAWCVLCGRHHNAAHTPCVTPRGMLPPGKDKSLVECDCCGAIYWADGREHKAAGGAVCPYCLVDQRKTDRSVMVHTLLESMPHEYATHDPVVRARNYLGKLVKFKVSQEVAAKRRKTKRTS
ncbi:hypothetical protein R77555_04341 [Ralstonia mannitolilytica]|uniref:hypothetical protein n=1 Tax=Ralstonia mannitolilytica TaxID=105219 RepID=UPI0028F552BC|nr:hypothetical protein [Ralstonia mannitolilytica]CAJ0805697.1 hypothetical protein R77555_04341 [Ralstonia mannitolilytica]